MIQLIEALTGTFKAVPEWAFSTPDRLLWGFWAGLGIAVSVFKAIVFLPLMDEVEAVPVLRVMTNGAGYLWIYGLVLMATIYAVHWLDDYRCGYSR